MSEGDRTPLLAASAAPPPPAGKPATAGDAGSGRAARAHTHFDLSTALPETKSARGARGVAPHTSPRHGTHRPATCRYLTGLHKQTRYHRARAVSIAPAVALLPLGGVPYYHHHTFITAKP